MLEIRKLRRKENGGVVKSTVQVIKSDDINYIKRRLKTNYNEPNCTYTVHFNNVCYSLENFKKVFNIK